MYVYHIHIAGMIFMYVHARIQKLQEIEGRGGPWPFLRPLLYEFNKINFKGGGGGGGGSEVTSITTPRFMYVMY